MYGHGVAVAWLGMLRVRCTGHSGFRRPLRWMIVEDIRTY